jgi:hypothetical protein
MLTTYSYTKFDFSGLVVKERYRKETDTVQKTKEKYEGDADLYDFLVSNLGCRFVIKLTEKLIRTVRRTAERDQLGSCIRGYSSSAR